MSESLALDLHWQVDEQLAGFRLHRLEVFNWGTFHGQVWRYELAGRSSLLIGENGSGKSTLVDGIMALLVPPQRAVFNRAAGASSNERSLRSYVLGHYRNEQSEETGAVRPVALRDASSYSVILGVFRSEGLAASVTLALVLHCRDPQAQPKRWFVVAPKALSIAEDFRAERGDISLMLKRLQDRGCEVFEDSFVPYSRSFRKHFGIEHEQALTLFAQTISMKSVENLDAFVRTHMLEPTNVQERIEALLRHFDDLQRAHQAVVNARRQVELLKPIVQMGQQHRSAQAQIAELGAMREALPVYFAAIKLDLLQQRLQMLQQEHSQKQAEVERLNACLEDKRREASRLDQAIRDNGGGRLQEIDAEIAAQQKEKARRMERSQRYQALLLGIDEVLPDSEERFVALRLAFAQRLETLRAALAQQEEQMREEEIALRDEQKQLAALSAEIDSLKARSSNIDAARVRIRQALCAQLGLDEQDLPFAGECLQVREEERQWEGAAERLLRDFALVLLVPDEHYRAVAKWIDDNDLRARLMYYRVQPQQPQQPQQRSLHPQSIVRKLAIKPDCAHYEWLEYKLRASFDYACCEGLEQFAREPRAITRAGQIKTPGGRHEKDDRHPMDDRSRYVLGWSNANKLRVLQEQRMQLEDRLERHRASISAIEKKCSGLKEQIRALDKLEEFARYEEIDWQSVAMRIAALEEESRRLQAASNLLQDLQRQREALGQQIKETDAQMRAALSDVGAIKSRIEAAQAQLAQARALAESSVVGDGLRQQLDNQREQLLGQQRLSVESCDAHEQEMRRRLQQRIERESSNLSQLAEDIVNAMRSFKEEFRLETAEMDASVGALAEYERMLEALQTDGLPRFEERFKAKLNQETINELAAFNAQLARDENEIRDRIEQINQSMRTLDYAEGRYIKLVLKPTLDTEIRDFKQDLRACIDSTLGAESQSVYSEERYQKVKAILDRLRGRDASAASDRNWRAKVTDVRNWFRFSASERWRADDSEYEHYVDSGGKSGGQKEKLAYTVLAASLAYQFGLHRESARLRSFRFVVIDEAFTRASDESARYALRLFHELDLQMLIVTPQQKIHVIEPFVHSVAFAYNEGGRDSRLRVLPIEQYRQHLQQTQAAAVAEVAEP